VPKSFSAGNTARQADDPRQRLGGISCAALRLFASRLTRGALSGRAGPPDPPLTSIGAPRTSRPTSSSSHSRRFHPWTSFKLPPAGGGWGGIGRWRRPVSGQLRRPPARTALSSLPRSFKFALGKMADGEGFEPSVHCCTHAFQACAFDHSATHPWNPVIKHGPVRGRKPRSGFPSCIPEVEEQESGGYGDGGRQNDEEEVDECVHAREQNTGGRTLVVLGRKNLSPPGIEPRFKV
jgi:hypothetical protein